MDEKNIVILIDVKQEGFSNKKFDIFNLIWIIDKMSTWTLDEPPTHLTWTSVDIWLTTYHSGSEAATNSKPNFDFFGINGNQEIY